MPDWFTWSSHVVPLHLESLSISSCSAAIDYMLIILSPFSGSVATCSSVTLVTYWISEVAPTSQVNEFCMAATKSRPKILGWSPDGCLGL